jgi:drug/metabolite transporter (DMT)-like permease
MRRPAVYPVAAATVLALDTNWPIMAAGVELVPPLWLAAMRVAGAAAVVAIVLGLARGMQRPARRDRPVVLSVGLAHLAVVTGLVFLALEIVAPGRSAIVVYTSALWAVPMAAVVLHEHPTPRRIAGVAVGCAGLVRCSSRGRSPGATPAPSPAPRCSSSRRWPTRGPRFTCGPTGGPARRSR